MLTHKGKTAPSAIYLACAIDFGGVFDSAYGESAQAAEGKLQEQLRSVLRPLRIVTYRYSDKQELPEMCKPSLLRGEAAVLAHKMQDRMSKDDTRTKGYRQGYQEAIEELLRAVPGDALD